MEYRTIAADVQAEFVERKSRFIGSAFPLADEPSAQAKIAELKTRYWDASHNVFAYCLRDRQIRRYSDDGEPQGTAGIPVLEVLTKANLTDLLVVVTRYFGGTLLGAGGLVRAYSHCAKLAVEAAGLKIMRLCTVLELNFPYPLYGKINNRLPAFGARVLESDFGEAVRLRLLIRSADVGRFRTELDELTAATVPALILEERYDEIAE